MDLYWIWFEFNKKSYSIQIVRPSLWDPFYENDWLNIVEIVSEMKESEFDGLNEISFDIIKFDEYSNKF